MRRRATRAPHACCSGTMDRPALKPVRPDRTPAYDHSSLRRTSLRPRARRRRDQLRAWHHGLPLGDEPLAEKPPRTHAARHRRRPAGGIDHQSGGDATCRRAPDSTSPPLHAALTPRRDNAAGDEPSTPASIAAVAQRVVEPHAVDHKSRPAGAPQEVIDLGLPPCPSGGGCRDTDAPATDRARDARCPRLRPRHRRRAPRPRAGRCGVVRGSTSTTRRPLHASSRAMVAPAGPAPATRMSACAIRASDTSDLALPERAPRRQWRPASGLLGERLEAARQRQRGRRRQALRPP